MSILTFPIAYLALLIVLLPTTVHAERVSLHLAVHEALTSRPMVKAHKADQAAAEAEQAVAVSRFLPRLSLNEQFYATNEPGGSLFISLNQQNLELSPTADAYNTPPSRKNFETRLTLNQALFDSDRSFHSKRAAIRSDAAAANMRHSQSAAALDVIKAYLNVQRAEAEIHRTLATLEEAEEVCSTARQRQKAGIGLHADVLRAEAKISKAQLDTLTAQHAAELARHDLAFRMGRTAGDVDIAAPLLLTDLPAPEPRDTLQRDDLQALRLQSGELRLAARQARATFLPKADLQASYILNDDSMPFGNQADAWSVAAGLRWDFFDGFERSHRRANALAHHQAALARAEELTRQTRLALHTARLQAEQARQAAVTAKSVRKATEEARQVTFERYHAGLTSLSDLLTIQSELENARKAQVEAEADQVLARAMMHFQQGTLLDALLISKREGAQ